MCKNCNSCFDCIFSDYEEMHDVHYCTETTRVIQSNGYNPNDNDWACEKFIKRPEPGDSNFMFQQDDTNDGWEDLFSASSATEQRDPEVSSEDDIPEHNPEPEAPSEFFYPGHHMANWGPTQKEKEEFWEQDNYTEPVSQLPREEEEWRKYIADIEAQWNEEEGDE